MDATTASPGFGDRNSASDDLVEHGCLVCGLLVDIESDPGVFTTPPVLSVHEASSESLNSAILNLGLWYLRPISYCSYLAIIVGDRGHGGSYYNHIALHIFLERQLSESSNTRDWCLLANSQLAQLDTISGPPHYFPPLHKTVAVSETCRVRGRGEIPRGTLTLAPVWNRHPPPFSPNRGRTRCPRNPLSAVPCTRGLFWRIESTYLDFALLPALVGDVAVTCYHLWLSKKCHRVIISFSGCRCPESSHPQIQPLRRIHRE